MTKLIKHGLKAGSVAALALETLRDSGKTMSAPEIALALGKTSANVCSTMNYLRASEYVTVLEGTWPRKYDLGPRAKP